MSGGGLETGVESCSPANDKTIRERPIQATNGCAFLRPRSTFPNIAGNLSRLGLIGFRPQSTRDIGLRSCRRVPESLLRCQRHAIALFVQLQFCRALAAL